VELYINSFNSAPSWRGDQLKHRHNFTKACGGVNRRWVNVNDVSSYIHWDLQARIPGQYEIRPSYPTSELRFPCLSARNWLTWCCSFHKHNLET